MGCQVSRQVQGARSPLPALGPTEGCVSFTRSAAANGLQEAKGVPSPPARPQQLVLALRLPYAALLATPAPTLCLPCLQDKS